MWLSGSGQGASERPQTPAPGAQSSSPKAPAFTCPRGLGSVGTDHQDVHLFILVGTAQSSRDPAGLSHPPLCSELLGWFECCKLFLFFSKSSQHTGKRPRNPGASPLLTLKSEAITEQKERVPAGCRGQRDDDLWLLWAGLWGPGARASVLEAPGDQALCGSLATEWPWLLLAVPVGSLPQVLPLPLSFHSIPPLPVFPSGLAASTSVDAYPPGWVELSLPKAGPFQLARS